MIAFIGLVPNLLKGWRTILVNIVALAAWHFWPAARTYVCDNQELTVHIVVGINIFMRWITTGAIPVNTRATAAIAALLLVGCSGVPQKLDVEIYYRRDLPFCVDGYGCFEGMTVLPRQTSYTFEVAPKGEAEISLLIATTCHRNKSYEKTDSGWFIFKNKTRFKYVYTPNPQIEADGDCALVFNTFERGKGRHAWAVILFEHPKYTLPYTLYCDGDVIQANGVGGCQSKEGLKQGLEAPEPIMIESDPNCPAPKRYGKIYEWPIGYRQCAYTLRSQSGRLGSLFTSGFRGELVREQK